MEYGVKICIDTLNNTKKFINKDDEIFTCQHKSQELKNNTFWGNSVVTRITPDSKHFIIFYSQEKWFITFDTTIQLCSSDAQDVVEINLFLKMFVTMFNSSESETKCTLETLLETKFDSETTYHFLLRDNMFRNIGISNENNTLLTFLYSEKNTPQHIISYDNPFLTIQSEKTYNMHSFEEIESSLNVLNSINHSSKKMSCVGYYVQFLSDDKKNISNFSIYTELYKKLDKTINSNKYLVFLELYQKNKLNEIIPYVHKYPGDVIKRINASMRILSKEILNIYHTTRKKQHPEIYIKLTQCYRKIIYDLHHIYSNNKVLFEQQDQNDSDVEYFPDIKKTSITIDMVYLYLKNLDTAELVQLFVDRNKMIELFKCDHYNSDLFCYENVDIIVQSYLMKII